MVAWRSSDWLTESNATLLYGTLAAPDRASWQRLYARAPFATWAPAYKSMLPASVQYGSAERIVKPHETLRKHVRQEACRGFQAVHLPAGQLAQCGEHDKVEGDYAADWIARQAKHYKPTRLLL